ncbi:tyrosine-type recombinase/integrase [Pararobbsia alpina]|uniref:DUF6538 domain-containing protein n=1 Tax=Pararobbsia alpina TaxID=621374 RepID=A0A6S7CVN5_9BURK|nr:tyrosine-type recombinase/integrase [Pararobbsia alpina]CAB3798829.1 hypothetical protein LMG28138_04534 [Pararobbsia alpina]
MSEHVIRRGSRYYYRRRVPADLIEKYQKTEHVQALGTANPKEAAKEARRVGAALDQVFDRLRAEIEAENLAKQSAYIPAMIDGTREMPPLPLAMLQHDEERAAEDATEEAVKERRDELREIILDVIKGTPGFVPVGLAEVVPAPAPSVPADMLPPPTPARTDRSLDRLVKLWELARTPESRAALAFHRAVDRFTTLVGLIPVPRITKAHIVQLKDKLLEDGVGPTSIDQSLNNLRTLFTFAIGQAWISVNPATGVKREGKRQHAKNARPPFDLATLNRIFANRVYTEGYRPARGRGEAAYWLPLLGLYTGARVEELCQLRPDDVYQDTYTDSNGKPKSCWVILITNSEDHGQAVKNVFSRRRVPIHTELLKLGFVDYANGQSGKSRVFDQLIKDKHGVESALWSQWWISMMRAECNPTSPKMVFHSFRHTFKDVCRDCGITKELADALQGHSEGDDSSNYGGEFYPLRPLVEAVDRYVIHGVKPPTAPLLP